MTQSSLPYDNSPIANEDVWADMARYWVQTGVVWGYASELNVYADSSGRQVKIQTGAAWVDGVKYLNDSEVIYPIDANTSGQPRIDRVVLRLDRSANSCLIAVVQGEPNASPVVPELADTSSVKYLQLAQVVVANGTSTIASGNITKDRVYGTKTGWQDFTSTPTVAAGTVFSISGWSQAIARYQCDGMTCNFIIRGFLTLSTPGSGGLVFPLPMRADLADIPVSSYIGNDWRRAKTTLNGTSYADWIDVYAIGSDSFPADGAGKNASIAGTFQIKPR